MFKVLAAHLFKLEAAGSAAFLSADLSSCLGLL